MISHLVRSSQSFNFNIYNYDLINTSSEYGDYVKSPFILVVKQMTTIILFCLNGKA